MAIKKLNENPRTTDTIVFELTTPDGTGCLTSDPYRVDTLIIYHVERNFFDSNFGEYTEQIQSKSLIDAVENAQNAFCDDPTVDNASLLEEARNKLNSSTMQTTWYYKERVPVKVVGTNAFPAWLSTDTTNASLTQVTEDADGNPLYGHFTYEWKPEGSVREGQYFACWTWSPLVAGEKLSSHIPFTLLGDPKAVSSIPTHVVSEDKYEILLERYLPEVYKTILCDGDLTPQTTLRLNNAVADGFTFIEIFANQIIDLMDANVLHESILNYLSNMFNLRLKSSDPTLWRRQIKEAIPLFKKKGTMSGLEAAFAQSGMTLNDYTQFWQVISSHTYEESFLVDDSATFTLAKDNRVQFKLDLLNINRHRLFLKREGDTEYTTLSTTDDVTSSLVRFDLSDSCVLTMTWIGDEASTGAIDLFKGDRIKIRYPFKALTSGTERQIDNYILSLPLADQRREEDQKYPLKNWNVKIIEEADPMFDIVVPVKHPFHEDIVFGYIRTEFPYGENIYNMDEYNGSTRPSTDPCNIDKLFMDPCGACLSSTYSVDVAIEEISNDRIVEAQDVLDEYMPFHANLHSVNFAGDIVDFIQSPVEDIDFLVSINLIENHLSGQANPLFHRVMQGGMNEWVINRDNLTDQITVASKAISTVYNSTVHIIAPGIHFHELGIRLNNGHFMEVLSPSANAGTYRVRYYEEEIAEVIPVSPSVFSEPIDESQFTFNITNVIHEGPFSSITDNHAYKIWDNDTLDFSSLGIKTLWDVEHTPDYTGGSWKVLIPAYSGSGYEIERMKFETEGWLLYLKNDGSLPHPLLSATSPIVFSILDDSDNLIASSNTGVLQESLRSVVNLNEGAYDIYEQVRVGDLLYYDGTEYEIIAFDGQNLVISNYADGNVVGISTEIRRRLLDSAIGQFGYRGLNLNTIPDHEAEFGIVNGSNPPAVITDDNKFKENYMFLINGEFFKILEWDGTYVKLAGRDHNWTTLTAGGTTVSYKLVHFPKKTVNVQFTVFDHLDRDGHDPVIREIESGTTETIVALSAGSQNGIQENVAHDEGISFIVERRNGEIEEGEL